MAPPADPGWPHAESPFHHGSRQIQARLGVEAELDHRGRLVIRDYLTDQHRTFFPQLPFVLVGSIDAGGQPWASMLAGAPGFARSPSPQRLRVDAKPLPGDPLAGTLQPGAQLGMLGIELPTRRRNRLNGAAAMVDEGGFEIAVAQTFGNCPKYIQSRAVSLVEPGALPPQAGTIHHGADLDEAARTLIVGADTLFIATTCLTGGENRAGAAGGYQGVDVSHRGGKSGFVKVDGNTLLLPDFSGNSHFRTLGNLQVNPRAGLLFVDFERGNCLYLAVEGEVIWNDPRLDAFMGAERLVQFHVRKMIRVEASLPLRFSGLEFSPVLERTGSWQEVDSLV